MKTLVLPAMPLAVQSIFEGYPKAAQAKLQTLRQMIFEEAVRLDVGALQETLKWGEPAYLTPKSKAGSTIRMAWNKKRPNACGLFFNCNTDLVQRMSATFPSEFQYVGNREVVMPLEVEIPGFPARALISMALTYHRDRAER